MTDASNDVSNDVSHFPPKKDALSAMPIVWGLALYLVEIFLGYWSDNTLELLGTVILLGILIACLHRGFKHLMQGRYKSAASLVLALLLLYFPMRHLGDITYNIRIALNEKQYLEEINSTKPDNKGFRYTKFLWNGRWGEGTELVYDESDEIALPEHRSNDPACPSKVKKIREHFYIVSFHCG